MLFVMNGDVPCTLATWVRLTPAAPPAPAPGRAAPGALLPETSTTFEAGAPQPFLGGAFLGAAATFDLAAGGAAAYSGARGAAVTVTTPGAASFHVQLFGPFVPLSAAKFYTAQFQIKASATTRVTVTWLREGDFLTFGTTSFLVDAVWKDYRLFALRPPADGRYHLQIEMGLVPAGTTVYCDDVQVFDLILPPTPNPLPPVNGDGGAPPPTTTPPPPPPPTTTPPPPPPPSGTGALVAAASEDFGGAAPFKYGVAQFAGAAATASYAAGNARITVTTTGTQQFHLQLVGATFVPLSAAGRYSARFLASASATTTISVLWLREGTFALLGLQQFTIGPTARTIELPAVSPPTDGAYHLQIEFGLAAAGTVLTFDTIEAFNGAVPATPPPPPPTVTPPPPPATTPPPPPATTPGSLLAATSENFNGPAAPVFSVAQFAGAAATVSFAGGAAAVTVTTTGTQQFHLQLKGPSVQLDAARAYTITARVRASAPTTVTLLWLQLAPIAPISPRAFAVSTTTTTLTLANVKPAATGPHHVQFEFGLAAAGTVVTVDDVVVAVAA